MIPWRPFWPPFPSSWLSGHDCNNQHHRSSLRHAHDCQSVTGVSILTTDMFWMSPHTIRERQHLSEWLLQADEWSDARLCKNYPCESWLGPGNLGLFLKLPGDYDQPMVLKIILLLRAWTLTDQAFNSASALPLNSCIFLHTNSLVNPQFSCLQNGGLALQCTSWCHANRVSS